MAYTQKEMQKRNLFAEILQEIKSIERWLHDALKPMDQMILLNESLKAKETNKREGFSKQALEKTTQLKERIMQEKGDEAVKWLTAILDKTQSDTNPLEIQIVSPERQAASNTYGEYFNGAVYTQLLSYAQLAYAYEQNGSPEEHALKLAVVFNDTNSALDYLYKNINSSSLHDACIFTLPDPNHCSFSIWQAIAIKYLKEEIFRKILGQACEIEDLIKGDCHKAKESKCTPNKPAINELKKNIEENYAKWNKLNRDAVMREANSEEYTNLGNQLLDDRYKLTQLRAGIALDRHIDLLTLRCYQERYIQDSSQAYQYMLSQGLTKKDYERFLTLDRTNAGENIPNLQIDGNELGYPGFYLKKINTLDEKEAAKAACLGKLTNCCQSLSGEAGEPCTIHGLTSPNGGFYILCKGDTNNPQLADPIIAQSWVWRSTTNALVFDSIESSLEEDMINTMTKHFYRNLGKKLCLSNETNKVLCGAFSGISFKVGIRMTKYPESPKDYYGYSDSKKQRIIFDKDRPWYFYENDVDALNLIHSILNSTFTSPKSLIESQTFCEMLNVAIIAMTYNDTKLLELITSESKKHLIKKNEFDSLVQNTSYFLSQKYDLDKIWEYLEGNAFYINTVDLSGHTLLLRAAGNLQFTLFERLIKKGAHIHIKEDYEGSTALHYVANQPEYLKVILESLPEQDRLQAIQVKDDKGLMPLHNAADTFESLKTLLISLPEPDRLKAIQIKDKTGKTILHMHKIAYEIESLMTILALLPEHDRLHALQVADNDGETPLHCAVKSLQLLITILTSFPEQDRFKILQVKDKYGKTPLHMIVNDLESFKAVITLFSKEDQLQGLQVKDEYGKTPLHYAASKPEFLKILLASFPRQDLLLRALQVKDNKGQAPLHYAASSSESLGLILTSLPEQDRLQAIQIQDNEGQTPLHRAASSYESVELILASLPEQVRIQVVQVTDKEGKTILSMPEVKYKPKLLKTILSFLSEKDRLQAMQIKDKDGWTLLNSAFIDFKLFEVIFPLLSEQGRLQALQVTDNGEQTPLHHAANSRQVFETILRSYPKQERLKILQIKDKHGKTPLNNIYDLDEELGTILNLLPEQDRLQAVQTTNPKGQTSLHLAIYSLELFKTIFTLLPAQDRLQALQIKDKSGRTPLHKPAGYIFNHPKLLEAIFTLLPDEDWITAIYNKDLEGKTLLDYATEKKYEIFLSFLSSNSHYKSHVQQTSDKVVQQEPVSEVSTQNTMKNDNSGGNDIKQEIHNAIIGIIEKQIPIEDSLFINSKIKALNDLCELINDKEDCLSKKNINPKSYGDIFEYWSNHKQFKNSNGQELTNLEMVDLERNVHSTLFSSNLFGTSLGDSVKTLIQNYKDVPLKTFNQEEVKRFSI